MIFPPSLSKIKMGQGFHETRHKLLIPIMESGIIKENIHMTDATNVVVKAHDDKPNNKNIIFDDVFKTMLEYLTFLVIPLINEVFHSCYATNCKVEFHSDEYHRATGKRIVDSHLRIEEKLYHIECQSWPDSQILIRMAEYDFVIAMRDIKENKEGNFSIEFPASCVLYLRHTKNTPDKLTIQVNFPNGGHGTYECPIIKVQDYTKNDIFNKNLLILLPYYLMRYENEMKHIGQLEDAEEADLKMNLILTEYIDICDRLYDECNHKDKAYLYNTLTEQIKKIAEYPAPQNEKERVIAMGGTAIKPQAQIILEQGISQGISQGIKQCSSQIYINMRRRGISRKDAMAMAELDDSLVEDLEKLL